MLSGALPDVDVRPCKEDVIALALARRAELVRAGVFAEAACLEADAQGTTIHRKLETFAAGSDIHAVQIPQEVRNGEYRPGALAPEMPTLLAGTRPDRVKRAQSLHARAQAVVEVTRNLVGRLSATRTADVRARVAGVLQKRVYTEGTDVKEGQLLFQIDPAPLQAALNAQLANLAAAQATYTNNHVAAERAG